ncbi:FHA domain-containing protein [Microbacterium mangrovi]|uniref:FHA domain-containing protein n=1 Tax=Microbacterium mangrovi TaxID=1348253 RepID=UPI000A51CC34|nr:FHA domain-containing protein [Microbacterium mangrovi]
MNPKQTAHEPHDQEQQLNPGSGPATTHAEWGAGDPHLIVTREGLHQDFPLTEDVARIGSGGDSDLRLDGLDVLHAEIVHDEDDEYVLVLHGPADETSGSPTGEVSVHAEGQILRTGAQFVLGPWRFVFMRAEFADHGRPHGGREGGEGTVQPLQPPRPDYSGHVDSDRPPHGHGKAGASPLPGPRQADGSADYRAQGDLDETDPDSGLPDPSERGLR